MKEFLKSLLSRKFVCFVTGTVLLYVGVINEYTWAVVAAAYIGGNSMAKLLEKK